MKTNVALIMIFGLTAFYEGKAASTLLYSPGKIITTKKSSSTTPAKESAKKSTSTSASSSSAASTTTSSTVDPAIMSKIEADFSSALNGSVLPELGDSMSWGGGTLTRTKKGELRYVNTNNGYYEATLKSTDDIPKLARENSDINNTWIAQYGVDIGNLTNSNAQNQQEAYRNSISHIATHGLQNLYNKDNPWKFDKGIAAYNDNGKTVFTLNGKVVSMSELQNSNEYKALTGANVEYEEKVNQPTARAAIVPPPSSDGNNIDYIKAVNNSSIDMLINASKKYKEGALTKDQYIEVALQVSGMADYTNKVVAETKSSGQIVAAAAANDKGDLVLIGTADNGKSKVYAVKQNSWDTKYGYKVKIIPDNPTVSKSYDLTIPSQDSSRTLLTDPNYLLSQIPDSFKVDKSSETGAPVVKYDNAASTMWAPVAGSETLVCVGSKDAVSTPQPSGSCQLGEQKTYLSNPGYANDMIPNQKKCLDSGLKMFQLKIDYACRPDFYLNKEGK